MSPITTILLVEWLLLAAGVAALRAQRKSAGITIMLVALAVQVPVFVASFLPADMSSRDTLSIGFTLGGLLVLGKLGFGVGFISHATAWRKAPNPSVRPSEPLHGPSV